MLNDDRYCREHPNGGYYVTVGRNAKIIFRSSSGANIKHSGFNLSIEAIGKYLTINPKSIYFGFYITDRHPFATKLKEHAHIEK